MDFFEASQIELSYLPKKSRYLGTNALKDCTVSIVILHMKLQNLVLVQWNIKRFSYDFSRY
jgi:hypothetical protein